MLVLSEFAGAAAEMGEALQVNPYDIETMSQAYSEALRMPEEERRLRMRSLRQRIASRDVHHWARSFIEALGGDRGRDAAPKATLSSPDDLSALAARLRSAERLVLLLDYDGTLVPFARSPDLAAPDRPLHDLLGALAAKPGVRVHVVSGRRKEPLERWLGDLPVGLHAEHGYWSRMAPDWPWVAMTDVSVSWKPDVRRILDQATATTPGALVEEKTASLAWHYRMAEPELGASTRGGAVASTRAEPPRRPGGAPPGREGDRGATERRDQGPRRRARPRGQRAARADDRRNGRRPDGRGPLHRAACGRGRDCRGVPHEVARYRVATPRAAREFLELLVGEP